MNTPTPSDRAPAPPAPPAATIDATASRGAAIGRDIGRLDHLVIFQTPPTGHQRSPRHTIEIHLRDGRTFIVQGRPCLPGFDFLFWRLAREGIHLSWDRPARGVRRAWSDIRIDGIDRGWQRREP